ncbi:Trimeric GatFAB AmidoTransferase(AdT) complex subunit [Teratosphaeriaceae sp. CCFEE 6253]|nr:Trimeric GatFAB AmidoTransferase(AdT) complex subunit [Teratosphaeriaceae sp. CCFEE 6253]
MSESSDSESLSPAHEALQHTLDNNLTVKKKSSWLNIGGTLRKGALSVKGAIDYVRGEPSRIPDEEGLTSHNSSPRDSAEDERTRAPNRPSMTQRKSTFGRKHAVASLRHHFPRSSTRQSRRGMHITFDDSDGIGVAGADGPERFSAGIQDDDDVPVASHSRRASLADSIIGSVRGLGRKVSLKKSAVQGEPSTPRRRSIETSKAATVPLPSSPIPIPNAPPALTLNFGPVGFMSPPFGGLVLPERSKLTDAVDIAGGPPKHQGVRVPFELEIKAAKSTLSQRRLEWNSDLCIPVHELKFEDTQCPTRRDGTTTPMPGTTLSLELDGSSERPPMFERHVQCYESLPRGLDRMRSLDALAEISQLGELNDSTEELVRAATIAHAADEAETSMHATEAVIATPAVIEALDTAERAIAMPIDDQQLEAILDHEPKVTPEQSPTSHLRPAPLAISFKERPSDHRDLRSASTVRECPRDMPALTPQPAPADRDLVDHGDIERWQGHGIDQSPGLKIGLSKPSPTKSVDLPYRLKPAAAASMKLGEALGTALSPQDSRLVEPSPASRNAVSACKGKRDPPTHNDVHDNADSVITDYDEFKTQHLFGNCDEDAQSLSGQDYMGIISPASGAHRGPVVTKLYQAAASSQSSSPTRARGNTIRSTDVGSVFWKFDVNNWIGEDGAGGLDATQASIDEDDDDDDESDSTYMDWSAIVAASTDYVPLSTPGMGNRIEFESQRSERDARYKALQTQSQGHVVEPSERPASSMWTFGTLQGPAMKVREPLPSAKSIEHDPAKAIDRAREAATVEANASDKRKHGITLSEDSGTTALDLVVRDTNQASLAMDGDSHAQDIKTSDAVPTSSPMRLTEWERQNLQDALPYLAYASENAAVREYSPKRATRAELVTPAALEASPTGGLETGGFSPTASIMDVSRNRFKYLSDHMASSPGPDLVSSSPRAFGGFKITDRVIEDGVSLYHKSNKEFASTPNSGYDPESSTEASQAEKGKTYLGREAIRRLLLGEEDKENWDETTHNHHHAQPQELNAVIHHGTPDSVACTTGPLSGKTVAVKDNIVTRTLSTTAASKSLTGYASPFDATVVELLQQHGATISAKTNLDEFGMGSHSQNSYAGPVLSPFHRDGSALSPGGSSGGSAVAVITGQCWAALGTDTGGSVRLPAAYSGTVGFKPSYGLLSRWGVIQYANSLDTVGILAQDVRDAGILFRCLDRFDKRDPTSLSPVTRQVIDGRRQSLQRLRIGVPSEYNIQELSPAVRSVYIRSLQSLQDAGHTLHPVALPATRQALSAYYVLAPAEASSNLAKYDGIRYGYRTEGPDASPKRGLSLYAQTRGEGFGEEVKRRILLGAYTLSSEAIDNYFIQAQKVRRLVQQDFDRVFAHHNVLVDKQAKSPDDSGDGVHVLLTPTAPTLPPTVEEVKRQSAVESYMNDVFTVPASLAGLPAVSVPVALSEDEKAGIEEIDVKTVGMQIIGQFGDDELVLRAAECLEAIV